MLPKMIFRYCGFLPEETEEKTGNWTVNRGSVNRGPKYKLPVSVLRYCPCVFRCRKPVGVGREDQEPISTITTTANTTPVIALRLNQSNGTIEKAVNEAEYNERNKHHFLPEPPTTYFPEPVHSSQAHFEEDKEHPLLKNSSPDEARNNRQRNNDQNERQDYSDSRSSTPQSQEDDTAFNVITGKSSPVGCDTVDSFMIPLGEKIENVIEPTTSSLEDVLKGWSSEDESRFNQNPEPFGPLENENGSDSTSESRATGRRRSVQSILSAERILGSEVLHSESPLSSYTKEFDPVSPSRVLGSPLQTKPFYGSQSLHSEETSRSPIRSASRCSPRKLSFEDERNVKSPEGKIVSAMLLQETGSFEALSQTGIEDSPAIVIASRPHSRQNEDFVKNNAGIGVEFKGIDDTRAFIDDYKINDILDDEQSKDSASETNTEPGILKIESRPVESRTEVSPPRRVSKVPRVTGRVRSNTNKSTSEKVEKPRPIVQQCFTQLENKDWEITMKGLKALSQISKQHPEYLDQHAAGTVGRLLGRHIKSLRSQVARAACTAAGDIFGSQIRGIDQDIDDIAGPLLHRTADTNRFLRADSNAALDQMIEHLPPSKTIGIIVHRGASHQNAIVRAATARLLSAIVDRVGPDQTMILQRDVRDKLLNTGARLLIDGNLDARNHAKKMFRKLTHCEGFRRALTDAVPETTLRHIDKTLKSL